MDWLLSMFVIVFLALGGYALVTVFSNENRKIDHYKKIDRWRQRRCK